ncbi:MAG: hypothetical protein JSW21_06610 [Gammaproteobacteria bacterium]|nr:MAG: hypothetical protein JSW21_06610 [Gammaproteobacteria bacterium]
MGTNGASNELLWVRPENPDPDVCVSSEEIEARAKLGALGFHKCTAGGAPSWGVVTTDVNRDQVLWFLQGQNAPADPTICDLDTGPCPERPDHVAIDPDGLLAIADANQAGGRIAFFQPTGDCDPPYSPPDITGYLDFRYKGQNTVLEIADLEFSDQIGGDFEVGDLLVLSSSPKALLVIKAGDIADFLGDGTDLPDLQVLLNFDDFDDHFDADAVPTSLAVVPGTGGLGLSQSGSKSPVVLMGLNSPDRIVELRFDDSGALASVSEFIDAASDGISPSRIDAGVLENIHRVLVATGNGVFYHYIADVSSAAATPDEDVLTNPSQTAAIASGVQNPGGVEVLDDVVVADLCVDDGAVTTDTGCSVGYGQFHFSQFEAVPPPPGSTLSVDYRVLTDNASGDFVLSNGGIVPSWCSGFPLPDDPSGREVFVELRVTAGGFNVEPGQTVQIKELLEELFPEFGTCPDSHARILYLEDEEDTGEYPDLYNQVDNLDSDKTLRPLSFSCTNPGRGAGPASSTFIYCRDTIKEVVEARGGRLNGRVLNRTIRPEIEARLARLELFIQELPDGLLDQPTTLVTPAGPLKANLLGLVAAARDSSGGGNPDFLEAARYMDFAAQLVFENKGPLGDYLPGPPPLLDGWPYDGPANIYGILLSEVLANAFFFAQGLTTMDDLNAATGFDSGNPDHIPYYCPPQALVKPVGSAEIRDVFCDNSLPLPDYP